MDKLKILIHFALISISIYCSSGYGNKIKLSEREEYRYYKAIQRVEQVEALHQNVVSNPTNENVLNLLEQAKSMVYEYDDTEMNVATMKYCDSLKMRIEECQRNAVAITEKFLVSSGSIALVNNRDKLIVDKESYPIYLKQGEKLFFEVTSSAPTTVKLYNSDSEKLIKSYKHSRISDSITIFNTGIYLVEIYTVGKQYVNVALSLRPSNVSDIYGRPSIASKQDECNKNAIGAVAVPGVVLNKCFDVPRKFTLRGQFKATFSGSSRALVAVQVPAGATDILYSMRIATSEQDRDNDGEFHNNLSLSYKRIKFLGLPLYEKSTSNGLLNTLLDDNRPVRDEDAYCNMYVFRNQLQAKQFQDGTKQASQLSYDVDYSTLGTQSCNGRIPVKSSKTIYLAFENERVRYSNYLWVEVEAVVPNTVYYTTKYSLSDEN